MASKVYTERKTCIVCKAVYKTGAVLIYRGARPPGDGKWGLCGTHRRLKNKGLIALVEVDPDKSIKTGEIVMTPDNAHRTGTVAYIGRNVYEQIFNGDPPYNGVAFVPPEVMATLQRFHALWTGEGTQH